MANKITNFFAEKYKLSLEIKHNKYDFDLFITSRFGCAQKVSIQWISDNRKLFKKKYQYIIDNIIDNMYPIFEPKVVSINLLNSTIECVNYLYDSTTIKLTRFNASKLNLNYDLV